MGMPEGEGHLYSKGISCTSTVRDGAPNSRDLILELV